MLQQVMNACESGFFELTTANADFPFLIRAVCKQMRGNGLKPRHGGVVDSYHHGTITGRLLRFISPGYWRQQRSDAKRVCDGLTLGECGRVKALDAERRHLHSSTSRSRRSSVRNTLRRCATVGHGPDPD
jgi:hypothetical protein